MNLQDFLSSHFLTWLLILFFFAKKLHLDAFEWSFLIFFYIGRTLFAYSRASSPKRQAGLLDGKALLSTSSSSAHIEVVLLDEHAQMPTKGTPGSAGWDLYSPRDFALFGGESFTLDTRVQMAIPSGFFGKIEARSGLASRYGIEILGGVVDSDYRGSIGVILLNSGPLDVQGEVLVSTSDLYQLKRVIAWPRS